MPEVRIAHQVPLSLARLVAEIPTDTGVVLHGSWQASGPELVPLPNSPFALPPQHTTPSVVRIAQYSPNPPLTTILAGPKAGVALPRVIVPANDAREDHVSRE